MKTKTKLIEMLYEYSTKIKEYKLALEKQQKLTNESMKENERLRKLIDTKNNEKEEQNKKYKDIEYKLFQLRESIPAIKNMNSEQMLEYLRCIEPNQI